MKYVIAVIIALLLLPLTVTSQTEPPILVEDLYAEEVPFGKYGKWPANMHVHSKTVVADGGTEAVWLMGYYHVLADSWDVVYHWRPVCEATKQFGWVGSVHGEQENDCYDRLPAGDYIIRISAGLKKKGCNHRTPYPPAHCGSYAETYLTILENPP